MLPPIESARILQQRCPKCDLLWREYAKAASEHATIRNEREHLQAMNSDRARDFSAMLDEAETRRLLARERFRRHLTTAHVAAPESLARTGGAGSAESSLL